MSQVSVFVPCYRYAHFLRACVESILTQPGVDVLVLIIDDASPDNTAEVAAGLMAQDKRVEYRRHTTNRGHIATYNEGLAWATGKYTVLLSADDMLVPGALLRATSLLDAHSEVGFVCGGRIMYNSGEPLPPPRIPSKSPKWQIWDGLDWLEQICRTGENPLACPEVMVRTDLQRKLGGYRAELPHTADMEMWMRFAAHAAVGQILDADQAYYRIHAQNMHLRRFSARLTEIRQHKAAFDILFQEYADCIPDWKRLRDLADRKLARKALGAAGEAIDGKEATSESLDELIDFAMSTYGNARYTLEYIGLRLRMGLDVRVWKLLQSVRKIVLPDWLSARMEEWLHLSSRI